MLKPTFLLLLVLAAPAAAHEFWIDASPFRPDPGGEATLRLFVGDGYPGEAYARNPKHVRSFFVAHGKDRTPVPGRAGADPAGRIRLRKSGLHVVAYHSQPSRIELPAKKFEAYLKEEGLERIVRLRKERGESEKPGRELYSRCAKALLAARGDAAGTDFRVGLPLELVAEKNPYGKQPDARLFAVRLWHEGRPLAGALVRAFHSAARGKSLATRTDARGRASFRFERGGTWMVAAVHMRTAPPKSGADWESLWASLTFELPQPKQKEKSNDS